MSDETAKIFYCETWKMNYLFFIGVPAKKFTNYIKDNFNYDVDVSDCVGNTSNIRDEKTGSDLQAIWIKSKKHLPELAHESLHAAINTLALRDWKFDFDNDEPLAYLTESIFRQALKD